MAGRPLVVYDDSCAFCTRSVRLLRRLDWLRRLDDEGYSTAAERYPELGRGALGEGLRVRFADGSVTLGADAVRSAAMRTPLGALVAWPLYVPGLHGIGTAAYRASPRGADGSAGPARSRPAPAATADARPDALRSPAMAGVQEVEIRDVDLRDEALALTRDLIRVDTSNPPGRETPAAVLLREYLEPNGVDCELVARDPDRANLVARIPAPARRRRWRFVGHTDVVPADPRDWTHPPFDARRRRRRLAVGPRRRRHEERGGGARRGDGRAGALRLPAARRPVVHRGRRRGGRDRRRRHALAARGAPRHPARLRAQRGRRRAHAASPTAAS